MTYFDRRGGITAELFVNWLDYTLKGSQSAAKYFLGAEDSGAAERGWEYESNALKGDEVKEEGYGHGHGDDDELPVRRVFRKF